MLSATDGARHRFTALSINKTSHLHEGNTVKKLLFVALLACSSAAHAVQYNIQTLQSLSAGGDSVARGLNEAGQVVGSSYNSSTSEWEAVVWNNTVVTSMGVEGLARAINNNGIAVGEIGPDATGNDVGGYLNPGNAFKFEGGVVTEIGSLGGPNSWSAAFDINDNNVIVGRSYTSESLNDILKQHAFKYENGVMSDLGTVSEPDGYSRAHGINDNGQIAGRGSEALFGNSEKHALTWDASGSISVLDAPYGYSMSDDINNNGVIVGTGFDVNNSSALLKALMWDAAGNYTQFGTFGGDSSRFHAVNDIGCAVGTAKDVGNADHAAISCDGATLSDLNSMVLDLTGWQSLDVAYDINEAGQIIGIGTLDDGSQGAFILTAVPVPAAVWLMGSALGLLGFMRRRRSQ